VKLHLRVEFRIDFNDILHCLLWGAILNGFMNLVFIFSTRHLLASEVTFFMLIEFCLGPIWVWLYFDESLSINSLVGGLIVLFCVSLFTYKEIKTSQKFI
jgi:drug/metabolite transporter (DMT)-like permease